MANFTVTTGTQSLTQNTEFSIAQGATYSSGSPKTSTAYVQAWIDLTALVAGDKVEIRVYRGVSAGTAAVLDPAPITIQVAQIYNLPLMLVTNSWDITVKLTTATTRSIKYDVIQDTNDVNAATMSTSAADTIFNYQVEASPTNATTFVQRVRILWSIIAGKANGLAISTGTTENFRDAADTKNRATYTTDPSGTRVIGSVDGT